MKFTVDSKKFADALARVARCIPRSTEIPALERVHIETHGRRVWLVCTDLDVTSSACIDAEVEVPGFRCVGGKTLLSFAKALKGSSLTIDASHEPGTVHVDSGAFSAHMEGYEPKEGVEAPDLMAIHAAAGSVMLNGAMLARGIDTVIDSISRDPGRPNITGARVKIVPSDHQTAATLTLTGVDGHRLANWSCCVQLAAPDVHAALIDGVIVPGKALDELRRMIRAEPEGFAVTAGIMGKHFVAAGVSSALKALLIDGSFPADKLPGLLELQPPERRVRMYRVGLLRALARMARVANWQMHKRIGLHIDGSRCTIKATNLTSLGSSCSEWLPAAVGADVGDCRVWMNHRLLVDALSSLSTEVVEIHLRPADDGGWNLAAVVITEFASSHIGEERRIVVMPLRP